MLDTSKINKKYLNTENGLSHWQTIQGHQGIKESNQNGTVSLIWNTTISQKQIFAEIIEGLLPSDLFKLLSNLLHLTSSMNASGLAEVFYFVDDGKFRKVRNM